MKILFIQPDCRAYRVKLFEELSKSVGDIDLLHFGSRKFSGSKFVTEVEGAKIEIIKFRWIIGLHKLVKSYDTVIAVFDPHWFNAFFLSFFFPKRIVYWGHGISKTSYLNTLRGFLGRKAKAIVTYDEKGRSDIIKLGIEPGKVFIANNTQHVVNSEDLSLKPKDCFLFVGRIQDRKKVEDLLTAFSMVKSKLPNNTRIVIVGSGNKASDLKAKTIALELQDRVQFVDGTTDDQVLKGYFSKAYAYVSPGHVGLGVLHSFAYGVPVITYKGTHHAPEYFNIKQNVTGKVLEPQVEELAGALLEIVSSGSYKTMGHQAYEHYTNNRTISHMVDAFKKAILVN